MSAFCNGAEDCSASLRGDSAECLKTCYDRFGLEWGTSLTSASRENPAPPSVIIMATKKTSMFTLTERLDN